MSAAMRSAGTVWRLAGQISGAFQSRNEQPEMGVSVTLDKCACYFDQCLMFRCICS